MKKVIATGIAAMCFATAAVPAHAMDPILPFRDVKGGMTGTAYTVVDSSGEIRSFDVDIVGNMDNGKGSSRMIMARARGPVIEQAGGILQGIGMALTENVTYDDRGMPQENSLMQYKIPARNDIGHIHVVFESSYEGTGPFGAKSIGEVVINTPLPAVADAIYHATHKRFYELPITREQIAMAVEK